MDVAPLRSASLGGARPAGLPEVARQIEAVFPQLRRGVLTEESP